MREGTDDSSPLFQCVMDGRTLLQNCDIHEIGKVIPSPGLNIASLVAYTSSGCIGGILTNKL